MTFHATTAAPRKTPNQNHHNHEHERDSPLSNHETAENNDDNKDLQDMLLGTTSTGSSSSDPNETLLLRIKSSKDVQIYAHPSDRIAKVKSAVLHALQHKPHDTTNSTSSSDTTTPYVRLIAAGRLLAPDSAAVQDFDLQSGQVVHAVIAHKRGAQAAAASMPARLLTSTRALRGTGINAAGFAVRRNSNEEQEDDDMDDDDDDDSDSEEEEDIDLEQGAAAGDVEQGTARHRHPRLQQRRERLGFDRLRDTAGLRRSEVATIRAYFSRYVDQWIRQHPAQAEQAAAGEADLVRRRLLQEDAWMQAQGPASEFRLNLGANAAGVTGGGAGTGTGAAGPNNLTLPAGLTEAQRQEVLLWRSGGGISATVGTDRDFAWGFMLGFFVGFLMLLWVWMPTVPHKQKLGILTGISVQLFLSLWQDPDGNGNAGSLTDDLVLTGDY